ncbi:glutamate biosynthesis-related protein [Papiliotrema laurentii]|uniref:S-methyl-5'-thioadenosine phosphorylase n=1 Tax=Papiliotrema laurentii TaxID=5418 RepID=A0AAD9D102_PAPLA|nr:glutamate biosynthesis-related protein [Papiliotrema laurentii]
MYLSPLHRFSSSSKTFVRNLTSKMAEESKVLVGVIGGSGLYHLDNLTPVKKIEVDTPWGKPSSAITISKLPSGALIAFISRHGAAHTITPSEVPARANIAALKHIGVQAIVAFSAVGSLREEIAPGHFIIPDQIIDRTKGIREDTFFRGEGLVVHSMFGEPFSTKLNAFVADRVEKILEQTEGGPVQLHTGKTVVCMEGPAFSTRAESLMYRQWGGDIINMSVIPEAKLAREAELDYTLICTSTDFDAWRTGHAPVTVEEVVKTLHTNAGNARAVAAGILQDVYDLVAEGKELTDIKGSMQFACVTRADVQPAASRKKLSYILPYFA